MSAGESKRIPTVSEMIEALAVGVERLESMYSNEVMEHEARIEDLDDEIHEARAESRDADRILDWVDQIVREAEGRMIDGESPGTILARVVTELRDQHALTITSSHVLSVVA